MAIAQGQFMHQIDMKKLVTIIFASFLVSLISVQQTLALTPTSTPTGTPCSVPVGTGIGSIVVTITTPGSYTVWTRMMSSANGGGYSLQVGNQCIPNIGGNQTANCPASPAASVSQWTWVKPHQQFTTVCQPPVLNLQSGTHIVKMASSNPGVKIDRLIFSLDPNCTPTGTMGSNCQAPTPTPTGFEVTGVPSITPSPTIIGDPILQVGLALKLHGIGNGGDSVNPTSVGNTSPLTVSRPVTIELLNGNNQVVLTKQGTIAYSQNTGKFVGTIPLGFGNPGQYLVRVKVPQYLVRMLPGIQTLQTTIVNALPEEALIAGDVNNDNILNILDFNVISDCYSDLAPARNCNDIKKQQTDITDDGAVNQFDYNLFIRELSVRSGQ
jgi:hypothetical protein